MIAKFVSGNWLAIFSVSSAIRNPTAMIRSYCWRASVVRFGT